MSIEILLILLIAVLVAGLGGLYLALKPRRDPALAEGLARIQMESRELAGRLAQMNEANARREAELQKTLNERLDAVSNRMGTSLKESAEKAAQSFGEIQTRLNVIDAAQKNLESLSTDIVGLQDILSNKQRRGNFGEVQLNDLVSAVLPPSAYSFQTVLSNRMRADCLLVLPNPPGPTVVDAKFPLESWHALNAANDEASRTLARRGFATDIVKHINDISQKYIIPGETAESALMFLPSEAIYATLHSEFPEVVEKSWRAKVWIVSPTTLWATLNTVRAVMKDVNMREQAHVIQKEVRELLKDIERLDDRVGKLATHFGQAQEDLRLIQTSSEKITKRGTRIDELEVEDPAASVTPIAATHSFN